MKPMTASQSEKLATEVTKFYRGQLNEGDRAALVRQFKTMTPQRAEAVITEYQRTHKSADCQELLVACQQSGQAAASESKPETLDSVLIHYRRLWDRCGQLGQQTEGYRRMFERQLRERTVRPVSLCGFGMLAEDAEAWLPYVFDVERDVFRMALSDLRGEAPAASFSP